MKARRPALLVLGLLTTGLVVAGCSSSGSGGSSAAGSADTAGSADSSAGSELADGAAAPLASAGGSAGTRSTAGSTDVARALDQEIRTGRLTMRVRKLDVALAAVRADATTFGGYVSDENTNFGSTTTPPPASSKTSDGSIEPYPTPTPTPSPAESVIILRVPNDRLTAAMTAIARTGQQVDWDTSVQDVTAGLADLASREKTQRDSLNRVRTLMSRATSLHDVVLLEGELSSREAELESIEAQQRALSGQADLATLTVTLRTATPPVTAIKPAHHDGFAGGLKHGWHAATATVRVVLLAAGAALPFAVLLAILAVIGTPLFFAGRRLWRTTRPAKPRSAP